MSGDPEILATEPPAGEDAMYTDEHGIPMLFDVVLPGDQLREAGIVLAEPLEAGAAPDPHSPDLDRRIRLAVEAALPKVSERTAALMRDALLKEVQNALREPAE